MAQSITIAIVLCAGLHSDPTEDSISTIVDVNRQHLEAHLRLACYYDDKEKLEKFVYFVIKTKLSHIYFALLYLL